MVNWRRRLFRQWDPGEPTVRGKNLGFTGRAGRVIIDDKHQLKHIRDAATPEKRAEAADGWLRKVVRNAERGFKDVGDPAILEAIDNAFKAVAAATIIATDELKKELQGIPGMEDFDGRGTRRDQADDPADLPLMEMPSFRLPGQRESGNENGNSAGAGQPLPEMAPWPEPRLELMPLPPDDDQN